MANDGFDRLGQRTDEWADRQAGRLADHPKRFFAGWVLKLFVAILVIGVLFGAVHFITSWLSTGASVASPGNVKDQYSHVIEDWQALQAAAGNACEAKTAASQPGDPTLIESPALAYDAKYRQIVVDYNRRQLNIFEARLVGPKGYPRTAPTLKAMEASVC